MAITFRRLPKFEKDFRALERQLKDDVATALRVLLEGNESALAARRNHQLRDYRNPRIWKIDVRSDKSYQISYERDGGTITLRRVCSHREIDRRP